MHFGGRVNKMIVLCGSGLSNGKQEKSDSETLTLIARHLYFYTPGTQVLAQPGQLVHTWHLATVQIRGIISGNKR